MAREPRWKRMNLNVETNLHDAFKASTAAQGKKMTDVLIEFIRDYVQKRECQFGAPNFRVRSFELFINERPATKMRIQGRFWAA
jgi:ParG